MVSYGVSAVVCTADSSEPGRSRLPLRSGILRASACRVPQRGGDRLITVLSLRERRLAAGIRSWCA